ncbi:MAG: DEAD/DEAH box helicase family protein [Leptolyngbyaceae cyanobacterium bins.349]|nr:DEAD/DEAH box helicase family protein [Leptolyngbyaceae cyanobacterium bins.349]
MSSPPSPTDAPLKPPTLRPYQLKLIKDLYDKLNEGYRRVAIIAGTGAGKTVIAGKICADTRSRGLRLLFLVHLDVLVGQTSDKMKAFGLPCGFIKAGWREDPDAPIQIASVQTMLKRTWWQTWHADIVLYDEGHTTVFSQVGQQLLYETHRHAIHLALTATPYRLGKEQLGDHLETLVTSPVPAELQRMGFLAPMKYYGMPAGEGVNLAGVQTLAGDFDERQLKNVCDRPELVERIVEEWQRLAPDRRTIAFCVDVEHALHVAEAFRAADIPADAVDGSTPIKQRQQRYRNLRDGKILVLTSCNVISIGFDEPSVEVGLLLRPTQSRALHQQQIGRVMRISPKTGKTHGIIVDQAGNLQRLGFPEDIQGYTLPTSSEPDEPGIAPKKLCPVCARVVWAAALVCPECGHQWLVMEPELYTDDLIEVVSEARDTLALPSQEAMLAQFWSLRRRMFQDGIAPDMAMRFFYDKYGFLPEDSWCFGSTFGMSPTLEDKQAYKQYLSKIAKRQRKSLNWVISEFQKEFGPAGWQEILRSQ